MDIRCRHPTKAGAPCSAAHYRDGYCRWHHPDLEGQRQAERAAGGKAKSNRARARKKLSEQVMSIDDLDGLLCTAITQVAEGEMDPGVGSAMAGIAKTVVGIRATSDFEKRLEALESAAGVGNVRRIGA